MISRLAIIITEALCKAQAIEEIDRELYGYGFFVLLSQGLFLLMSTLFGFLLGTPWESIIFYFMFSTLRCYAGGFHASKERDCTRYTTLALLLASGSIRILSNAESSVLSFAMLAVSYAVVYLLSPLDSENKPLSVGDFKEYRKKSRTIGIVIVFIAITGIFVNIPGILHAASSSMVLESFLLVLGKAKRKTQYSVSR